MKTNQYLVGLSLFCLLLGIGSSADGRQVPTPLANLQSNAIVLPEDDEQFMGADSDLLNGNCLACHSTTMIRYQPALSANQWRAIVHKMRDVYKAPIAPDDVEQIVSALGQMQSQDR